MRIPHLLAACLLLCSPIWSAEPARAGSGASPTSPFAIQDIANFSKEIERELAARGARVAIVFRSGRMRGELPDGVRYTHGAFWVHSQVETTTGETLNGYSVHNLYHGEEDRLSSSLVQDWPINFTAGDHIGEVGIIIPTREMQRRILHMMISGDYQSLHHAPYSLLSNPLDLRFQNCNEFMLDVIGAAAWETVERPQIKANLEAWFEPTRIQLTIFERLFGPSADDRLRLDDHRGRIRTATFGSMGAFMQEYKLSDEVFELEAGFLQDQALTASRR
ncbi:MAG: DUF2145 domain-containing protein [Maricaulis sp.]|nr:DUF2145 domain-containing protein [Maricaulis sp.]